jgi:uncharacterized protein
MNVPIFPLHTVLYPEGPLPLRIFEPRYLGMISSCLKAGGPFGVVLIRQGSETGPATTFDVGTLAQIVDWYQGSDGVLGITAVGGQRFRILACEDEPDGLKVGEVELLVDAPCQALPGNCEGMAKILDTVLDDLGKLYADLERHYDDAGWVANRFAEILPLSPRDKQRCLETDDPLSRLDIVRKVLRSVRDPEFQGYV